MLSVPGSAASRPCALFDYVMESLPVIALTHSQSKQGRRSEGTQKGVVITTIVLGWSIKVCGQRGYRVMSSSDPRLCSSSILRQRFTPTQFTGGRGPAEGLIYYFATSRG